MSSAKLQGRVAIITGASRGIGKEIALTLASHGASVVVCFQGSVDKANEVVDLIKSKSGNAIAVQVDVSREADVKALFDKAEEAFGSVHILVNSAGILLPRHPTLEDTTLHEWEQTFAINSRGSFLPSREAAKRLVRGGGGRIVNLSTSLVAALLPGYGAYTVSKAGIEALTKDPDQRAEGKKNYCECSGSRASGH
ncbi:hypothetical protein O6H91_09G086800 [Diphasiastrum complanatum]|uniref:Uncharacterized protein n=1 Tax=Diphasiastrum complanatum TaxID=34168 RepID=A0ACC2CRN5_DIPCM|nr:hypothetical protein O6H91_09G086800 [Diphasiastrum complanatum]